jgi:hypothetical protein
MAGVIPFCPGPAALKLNSDPVPPLVDVGGVTGVSTNAEGSELAVVERNVGLFIVGQKWTVSWW